MYRQTLIINNRAEDFFIFGGNREITFEDTPSLGRKAEKRKNKGISQRNC